MNSEETEKGIVLAVLKVLDVIPYQARRRQYIRAKEIAWKSGQDFERVREILNGLIEARVLDARGTTINARLWPNAFRFPYLDKFEGWVNERI